MADRPDRHGGVVGHHDGSTDDGPVTRGVLGSGHDIDAVLSGGHWLGDLVASEVLALVDGELRLRFLNPVHERFDNYVGMSLLRLVEPEYHESLGDAFARAITRGCPQHLVVRALAPRGERSRYSTWVVPLAGAQGAPIAAIVAVDVSRLERAERDLAHQSSVLQALVDNAPDSIMIVDREYRAQFSNRPASGQGMPELAGFRIDKLVSPEQKNTVRSAIDSVFRTGLPTSYESSMEMPDGQHWFSSRIGPVLSDGEVDRVSVVSTDITKSKQAQQALACERELLEALQRIDRLILATDDVDRMIGGTLDLMLDVLACDRAWLLFPCDPESQAFSVAYERCKPDVGPAFGSQAQIAPLWRDCVRAALASDGVVRNDPERDPLPQSHALFSAYQVRSMLSMALWPERAQTWLLGIHDCRRARVYGREANLFETMGARLADGMRSLLAQRALRQSEARFRTLFENAPEAIVIFDADSGVFVDANRNALALFGKPRHALLQVGPSQMSPDVQPDGRRSDEVSRTMIEAALLGEIPTFEWVHLDSAGEAIPCEVRLVRLPHPERRLLRGSITDISERKRTEEENRRLTAQLFQSQKLQAIGQLTGGIAHDFNNLLTVITGSLELVELDLDNTDQALSHIENAADATRRAAELTQRLLAFSRKQPLRPCPVDLNALLHGLEGLLRRTLDETIAVSIEPAPDLWICQIDPGQVEHAILNLVINARDAMPDGGRLTIESANASLTEASPVGAELAAPGEYVRLSVADTGSGMAPDVLEQVFEPFFTTKEVGRGSGLGLSTVYGFVKQSGGHVNIRSELGRGTTVELYLPRMLDSAAASSSRPPSTPGSERQRAPLGDGELILVVEDDEVVRSLVVGMLRRLGYRTVDAANGIDALSVLRELPDVALLLSDVVLGEGMNGAELAARVRARRPAMPVLFMSGYTKDVIAHDGQLEPGVALLEKPFSSAALAQAVGRALETRRINA